MTDRDHTQLRRAAAFSAAADLVRRYSEGNGDIDRFHDQLDACVAPYGAGGRFDGGRIVLSGVGGDVHVPLDAELAERLRALDEYVDDAGDDDEYVDDALEFVDGDR